MDQRPTIGRIVHVRFRDGQRFNGSDTHPAIVTAAFGDGDPARYQYINCRVFVDGHEPPMWLTSINRAELDEGGHTSPVWFWPPREGA
jgi:hypothetical protein